MLNVVQIFKNDSGKARALEVRALPVRNHFKVYIPDFSQPLEEMCKKAKGNLAFSLEQTSG